LWLLRTRWPIFAIVLTVIAALSPTGLETIHQAFYSNEQLSRTLTKIVLAGAAGIALGIGVIEWGVRWYAARKRTAQKRFAGQSNPTQES
jgi:hypothetical protein